MKPAEMPEGFLEPKTHDGAPFLGGAPGNDTEPGGAALSSSALLRLGGALIVAGGAVVVGVLMAAVAARLGGLSMPAR